MDLEAKEGQSIIFSIKKFYREKINFKTDKHLRRIKNNAWTEEEDKLLISLYSEKRRKKWVNIAKYFKNKSKKECMLRYLRINPKIKKGKWAADEDKKLYFLVKQFGFSWSFISKVLKDRNHKQIRARYFHFFVKNSEENKKEIQRLEQEFCLCSGFVKN